MNRLKRQKDFDTVFSKGKRVYARSLCMVYLKKSELTLIGVSVSKRHGKAVVRNRIKRLLRAVYYPLVPSIKSGYYIVFLPKVANEYSYKVFSADINYLLKKECLFSDQNVQ